METYLEVAAGVALFLIILGIFISKNSPSAKYRKSEKEYLSKANRIPMFSHVYRVGTKEEFDNFSLDAFLENSMDDGAINRYIKQVESVISQVNKIRGEFMALDTAGVSPSTLTEVKEDARIEFDRIARDKDFFTVICLYVDEQGNKKMTSSMCGKKYLVKKLKEHKFGGAS